MFVNANAEHLRARFVAHEGQKSLMIDVSPYPVWNVNMGKFAQEMTHLIEENVVDAELRDWILPNFTTTTDDDTSVASIVMMGTLQKYFDYILRGGCGFPSVTLLGERSDWEKILDRARKLSNYGPQTTEWSRLLLLIIQHMIASFDQPNSQQTKDFWLRAVTLLAGMAPVTGFGLCPVGLRRSASGRRKALVLWIIPTRNSRDATPRHGWPIAKD